MNAATPFEGTAERRVPRADCILSTCEVCDAVTTSPSTPLGTNGGAAASFNQPSQGESMSNCTVTDELAVSSRNAKPEFTEPSGNTAKVPAAIVSIDEVRS